MGKSNKLKLSQVQQKQYTFPTNFLTLASHPPKHHHHQPRLTTLLKDQIITIPNFLNQKLCHELISSFEQHLQFTTTPLQRSKEYAARVNDRAMVMDHTLAQLLYRYLRALLTYKDPYDDDDDDNGHQRQLFEESIGLNPNLRVYRYTLNAGHFFNRHYDEEVMTEVKTQLDDGLIKGKTRWTLLIYLTGDDDVKGGDTVFHQDHGKGEIRVHPSCGMALLHKHGDDCLLHELEPLTSGVKWVLRSDLVYTL